MTTLNKVCTRFWHSKVVQTLFKGGDRGCRLPGELLLPVVHQKQEQVPRIDA
jgi:hypothetical protein